MTTNQNAPEKPRQDWVSVRNEGKNHIIVEVNGKEVIREFYVSGETEMNHAFNMTDMLQRPDLSPQAAPAGLREAIEDIIFPVRYLQKQADKDGCDLNGAAAIQIADTPSFLKDLAKRALSIIDTTPEPPRTPGVDVEGLANFIRSIDGENKMGAGELAERVCAYLKPTGS